jgi:tRNA(Ile)-lysidine synthase
MRLYHGSVHALADRLLAHIQKHELLKPGDRVGVAVSGGADSIALLRLLLEIRRELGIVLSVVHLNHKLRGAESDADEEFVSNLAAEHSLMLHVTSAEVAKHAAESRLSIEAAARVLRYDYFTQLLQGKLLDKVATGHTLDDQAETVLLRLVRGTGMRGLRAIQPRIQVDHDEASGEVIRPLLTFRRNELQAYLNSVDQPWREDSTNQESKYTRNRVRQVVIPLLEREFNPSITQNLAELAEIARAEEDYWESEVEGWMGTVVQWTAAKPALDNYVPLNQLVSPGATCDSLDPAGERMSATVDRNWLLAEPLALQRRVIKSIGDYAEIPLEFKHIEEILEFAAQEGEGNQLTLPQGWRVMREGASLEFRVMEIDPPIKTDYEYSLSVPGEVEIKEMGLLLRAILVDQGITAEHGDDDLFDRARLSPSLVVRNWRPGDRFWPAHTKGPKKIKELLQDKNVPQAERRVWPVVLSGDEIVWVRGFPGRAHFRPDEGNEAILISELSLSGREINE